MDCVLEASFRSLMGKAKWKPEHRRGVGCGIVLASFFSLDQQFAVTVSSDGKTSTSSPLSYRDRMHNSRSTRRHTYIYIYHRLRLKSTASTPTCHTEAC